MFNTFCIHDHLLNMANLENIYKFNNTFIHIDNENKNKLYDTCTSFRPNEVTIKCIYKFYFDIIFDNTSLPNTLIELICIWLNDEVIFEIDRKSTRLNSSH